MHFTQKSLSQALHHFSHPFCMEREEQYTIAYVVRIGELQGSLGNVNRFILQRKNTVKAWEKLSGNVIALSQTPIRT